MATTTKTAPTEVKGLAIESIEKLDEPMRGRGYSPEVLQVREALEASLKDRQGRSFLIGTEDGWETKKTEMENLVRRAAKAGDEVKVSIRFAKSTGRLMWGPKEVMDELAKGSH